MAERTNRVPDSMSIEIPGFREAQARWNEGWRRTEARDRAIAADRAAFMRSKLNDQSAQARLMSDLNPLVQAGSFYAGELAAAGLGAVARSAFSTNMRPGFVRFGSSSEVGASRQAVRDLSFSGASSGSGGVTLNQTISDALKPTRVLLEQTVDKVPGAQSGMILYSPIGGGETSLLNPGKIVRHGPSPWNAAVETRIRDLAPKIGPSSPTAYRVGVEGRTITEKMIAEFNKSAGEAVPSVSESVWSAPRSGMLGQRTVDVYKSAQDTIRKIYADKEAVKALNSAFRTGNFDDPVMKLYQAAKESYSASKAQLERYAAKYTKGSSGAQSPYGEFSEAISAQNLASSERIARRLTGKKTFAELAASVKPGTLWSDHIFPWLAEHPVKNSLKVIGWSSPAALALTAWAMSGSEKRSQDGTTDEVKKNLDSIKENYLALTNNDAVASAMSDASLLRRSLFALRDNAEAEMTAYPDRGGSVSAAVNAYLDRVGNSPAMQELISRNEEAYRGIANGDDFRSEFRARYPDVLSRAIGDDFYKGALGGAR